MEISDEEEYEYEDSEEEDEEEEDEEARPSTTWRTIRAVIDTFASDLLRAVSPCLLASQREAFALARAESQAAFGDPGLYLERYLTGGRHIEVQVLADRFGHAIHVGERECPGRIDHARILVGHTGQRDGLGAGRDDGLLPDHGAATRDDGSHLRPLSAVGQPHRA